MRPRRAGLCIAGTGVLLLVPPVVSAQQPSRTATVTLQQPDPRSLAERLAFFPLATVDGITDPAQRAAARDNLAAVDGAQAYAFLHYALPPSTIVNSFREFARTAQRTRVDQQIGSAVSGGNATTAASKTGLTTLLGFALEAGAITQTIDQNVGTLRANADGLLRFLTNQEVIPACAPRDSECAPPSWLKDVELAASFNVSDAGMQSLQGTVPGSGSVAGFSAPIGDRQLSGFSVRYAVSNPRDPRSPEYRAKWLGWLQSNRGQLGLAGDSLLSFLNAAFLPVQQRDAKGELVATTKQLDQFTIWSAQTRALLAKETPDVWPRVLAAQLDDLLARMRRLDPEFDTRLSALADAYMRYLSLQRSLLATLVTDPGLTVEYLYSRPALQPKLHTVRVAWSYSPRGTRGAANTGTITLNAAVDRFHDPQLDESGRASMWKDAQAALQFDRPLGSGISAAQLSVGAYFQYQLNPGVFTVPEGATTFPGTNIALPPAGRPLLAEKGPIVATQAMLTIRLADSGLKIPLGVSWANRSELAPGNVVRGHIGFTFDTTPLLLIPALP